MPYSVRLTRNQQAVLDVLSQQAHPVSAQELYRVLRQHQAIGLATVYRAFGRVINDMGLKFVSVQQNQKENVLLSSIEVLSLFCYFKESKLSWKKLRST